MAENSNELSSSIKWITSIIPLTSDNPDKYILQLENETVSTDDNLRFLNKTKNYIFLFDKWDNRTHIYKLEDIKSIKIETQTTKKLFEVNDTTSRK